MTIQLDSGYYEATIMYLTWNFTNESNAPVIQQFREIASTEQSILVLNIHTGPYKTVKIYIYI